VFLIRFMSVSLNSVNIISIKPVGILMRNVWFPPLVNTYLSFGNCCRRNFHNVKNYEITWRFTFCKCISIIYLPKIDKVKIGYTSLWKGGFTAYHNELYKKDVKYCINTSWIKEKQECLCACSTEI